MNEDLIKDLDEARIKDFEEARIKCPKCNNNGYDFLGGHSAHPSNRVACDCKAGKKFANSGEEQFRSSSDTKEKNPRQELYDTAHRRAAEQLTPWPKQSSDTKQENE